MPGFAYQELDTARAAVLIEADRVTESLGPALECALRRGVERLMRSLGNGVRSPTEGAADGLNVEIEAAIAAGIQATLERLRAPEIWLSPLTAPDLPRVGEQGWGLWVPSWVASLLRGRSSGSPPLGDLDDPSNRVWVAVCAATGSIDAVLERHGLRPVPGRRMGGGRYGVGPRSLPQLDPSGALARRWRAYRAAYQRLSALLDASV